MSRNSTRTWRSLVGGVVVAVATAPALVGIPATSASASLSERALDEDTRISTTLSIRATARPADGAGSVVRGRLLARGVGLRHREVRLLARTVGNPFTVVTTARTDRDGVVRFRVRPVAKTAYRLKFAGTRLLRPSRSRVVRIGVRPVVTASAAPTAIDPGESTTVSGVVTYEEAPYVGATVDLLARKANRHAKFRVVATGTTSALGEVSFEQSPARTTVYRLVVRHTEGTPPRAVSGNVRVVVRTSTSQATLEPISEGASDRLVFAGGDRVAPRVGGVVVN